MIPSSFFSFPPPLFFSPSFPLLSLFFFFSLPFYFFPSFSSYHSLREALLAMCPEMLEEDASLGFDLGVRSRLNPCKGMVSQKWQYKVLERN